MQLTIDRLLLENLLKRAASAVRIVGNLVDAVGTGPLAEHIDAIVHELTKLLGNHHALVAPDDRVAHAASIVAVDIATLEGLLGHAASAARLLGHIDGALAASPLVEHVDAIVHELTELFGDPRTLAAPGDRAAYDGAPMLTSSAGGAQ